MEIINSKWDALLHPTFNATVDNLNLPRFEFEGCHTDQEYNKFFVPNSIRTTTFENNNVVYHFPDGDLVFSI